MNKLYALAFARFVLILASARLSEFFERMYVCKARLPVSLLIR